MQPPLVPSCGLASNGWRKANAARRTSSHVIATRVPPRACLRCATLTATNLRPRMLGPIISGHSTLVFTRPPTRPTGVPLVFISSGPSSTGGGGCSDSLGPHYG
jgi:hypothetical protein